jgi:hypothetical protein
MENTEDIFDLYFKNNIDDIITYVIDDCYFNYNYLINRNNKNNFYEFLKNNININTTVELYELNYIKNINEEENSEEEY